MTATSDLKNGVLNTEPSGKPRAASYGRRSNPNDEAVGNQHSANAQRAESDGWVVPDLPGFRFGDDATSGETTNRDGIDALVNVVTTGQAQFDRLYIRDRGRLARAKDPRFIFWFEYTMLQHGVQVCYSVDKRHIDYDSPLESSELVGSFVTSAVENVNTHAELRAIRMRTRLGTRTHVTKGYFVGARPPYGTERWLVQKATNTFLERVPDSGSIRRAGCGYRLKWDESAFPAIRRIFDGLENGSSLREVTVDLMKQGMLSPGAREWTPQVVWSIARNPLYKGDWHFGRTKHDDPPADVEGANLMGTGAIYVRGFLPGAPVSEAQWDLVQRILDGQEDRARKRRSSRPDFLLTGILRCAGCGARLHGHTNPRTKGSVRMYRHEPARGKRAVECQHENRYLQAQPLEESALRVTERCLDDEVLTQLAHAEIERKAGELESPSHAGEIAAARKTISRLERAAAAGSRRELEAETEAEREVYAATVREVSGELAAARTRLAAMESAEATLAAAAERLPRITEKVIELRQVLAGNTPKERKRVIAALIEGMLVDFGAGRTEVRVRAVA
jgi:hypothetical protein